MLRKSIAARPWLWLFLACILVLRSPVAGASTPLVFAIGEFPPYVSSDLEHHGVATRIVREAFRIQGLEVSLEWLPWVRAIRKVEDSNLHGSFPWVRSMERSENLVYSVPIFHGATVFFHRQDRTFDWQTLADLKGLRIGATRGYQYSEEFQAAVRAGELDVEIVNSDEVNLRKLNAGRIDVFPVERAVGRHLVRELGFDGISWHRRPLVRASYHLIMSRDAVNAPVLVEAFSRGRAQLLHEGRIEQFFREADLIWDPVQQNWAPAGQGGS